VLREAIEIVSRAAESRELQASGHGDLVARYAEIIGRALGMSPEELIDLVYAARVHDVGKIFVPERILNKTGALTDDEFYLLRNHAQTGADIIGIIPGGERLRMAVEHHHESLDGSGYPRGLRGERIPLWARIIGLADAYADMTAESPFGPAKSREQALAELEKLSGLRHDGMLVRLLIRELKAEKAPNWGS
jgi:HD-GYP domain-containing protein (c-di-GMP phosphodiesterase class II)